MYNSFPTSIHPLIPPFHHYFDYHQPYCSNSWSGSSGFEPPIERANYLAAKEKLDPSKPADLEELRKLLMRRAIKAIPIVLSLQNEGNSIERLYKRGMLTDDMHFKVKDLKAFVDQEFQDVQYEADDLLEVNNINVSFY